MAGNWQRDEDERRRRRTNELTEEDIAAAAAALIVGAGVIYEGFRWLTSGSETKEAPASRPRQLLEHHFRQPVTHHHNARSDIGLPINQSDRNRIVIAVDATKQRAGGILLLPKSKTIYFYSIDWSNIFSFPDESDKCEMVNAFLALEIFKNYVRAYRAEYPYDSLCLKTNSTFCTTSWHTGPYFSQRSIEYNNLFTLIDNKLRSGHLRGSWANSNCQRDVHLNIAEKLSREDNSTSKCIQYPVGHIDLDPFPDYTEQNISKSDYAVLHTMALYVPFALKRA